MVKEPTGPGGCGLPTILLGVRQQNSPAAGALRSRPRSLRDTTQESRKRRVGAYQLRPFFLPLFTEVRGRGQPVEKPLRALFCSRFGGRIRRFCSVFALFSGPPGPPTWPTPTFSTGWGE